MGQIDNQKKAPAHYVSCMNCGKQFDTRFGYAYIVRSKRYVCPDCANRIHTSNKSSAKIYSILCLLLVIAAVIGFVVRFTTGNSFGMIGGVAALVLASSALTKFANHKNTANAYEVKKAVPSKTAR